MSLHIHLFFNLLFLSPGLLLPSLPPPTPRYTHIHKTYTCTHTHSTLPIVNKKARSISIGFGYMAFFSLLQLISRFLNYSLNPMYKIKY